MAKAIKKKITKKVVTNIVKQVERLKASVNEGLHELLPRLMRAYGEYTLEDRAVPAYQDGLKPSQRRLLWTMFKMGLYPTGNTKKSARIVGNTMTYHPHGPQYDALCNMVEGTPCPLVIGQGNFGSFSDAMPAANERYTEAKLSKFTMAALFDKRMSRAFPVVPNYDGSEEEPVYLPATIPLILTIGQTGIAMGATCDIPAFSVPSVIAATKLALKHEADGYMVPPKLLSKTLALVSNNAYGGVVNDTKEAMHKLITTGVQSFDWDCNWTMTGDTIDITGIPPGKWNFDNKLEAFNNIPEVAEAVDISEGESMHVKITFRRVAEAAKDKAIKKVLGLLKSKTHYKTNVTLRYLVKDEVVDFTKAEFASMSIQQLLAAWTLHRVNMEKVTLGCELEDLEKELARHELLKLAVNNLDIIFAILKQKGVDKVALLSKKLKITKEDSESIWAIAVGRLDRLNATEIEVKIKDVKAKIKVVKDWQKKPAMSVIHHMDLNMAALSNPIGYEPTAKANKRKSKKKESA